jgi:hypothetical protein
MLVARGRGKTPAILDIDSEERRAAVVVTGKKSGRWIRLP